MRLGPPPRMTIFLLVGDADLVVDELRVDSRDCESCVGQLPDRRLVRRVVVRRVGLELRGAGVHQLVDRLDAQFLPLRADGQRRWR